MEILVDIILKAGRSAVELSLFVLLPVMVVMLALMRILEARGVVDRLVAGLAPLLRPFGLTGLGVFAALQINFVSFAAPLATLTMMEQRGASDRHLAATLAMVFAMTQANTSFPMVTMGLHLGPTLLFSLLGGLMAAAATYYLLGRHLSATEAPMDETLQHRVAKDPKGVLDVINHAGAEAFKIAVGAIPMLVLSLVVVTALRQFGAIDLLTQGLTPLLVLLGIDPALILPTLTKYLAGGTAMMGVMDEMLRNGQASATLLNASAGFLIHPFDVPGVAVLISAGPRVARVWKVAALGACVGIGVRTLGHALLY
ncbi:nucleoside recognition domain-containing protein [Azovibrio restrictus]|uniref:nucleoside recognition domain-containing protein n=1 Tax=Azovibrio restrictus TaxID=146938 RepID=UPI0026E970C1|nr:nucleoside recognition domain-containing protein [Azovibrio restrictus]MDD3482634.1 nucleoside recognition domain-containing protein [Azovibrio restrictus]